MFDLYGVQDVYLFHYQSFFVSNGRSGLTLQMLASQPSSSHVPFLLYHFLGQKLGQKKKGFGRLHCSYDVPGLRHAPL